MILHHPKKGIAKRTCNFPPYAGITRIRFKSVISARYLILNFRFKI